MTSHLFRGGVSLCTVFNSIGLVYGWFCVLSRAGLVFIYDRFRVYLRLVLVFPHLPGEGC